MSIRITGMNSGLDTDSMVKELVKAYEEKGQDKKNNKTKHEWKQEIWTDLNKKIKSFSNKVNSMKFSENYNLKKTISSDDKKVTVVAGENAVKGTQTIKVKSLAAAGYLTSKNLNLDENNQETRHITKDSTLSELGITSETGKISITVNGKETLIDANKDTKIGQIVDALNATGVGVDASFDENNGRFFISAEKSGIANDFDIQGLSVSSEGTRSEDTSLLSTLGLTVESGASIIEGADAEIVLNGATFKSSSNSFDINGMAINVKGITDIGNENDDSDDETITLTTDTDVDAIYNNIKSMIKEYTSLINELSKLYNADSARGYDPLSDEEKDAMSDTEVEKWETKIKDSLLRGDSTISSIMNAMKNASLASYEIEEGGDKMTLTDFGIGTISYFSSGANEKSALHIDGDEDDDSVSANTNKLKQMITKDSNLVANFFSQFMTSISEKLTSLSSSTTNRSYGNFYDDKKMKSDLSSYEKKISEWEEYVADIEDKYYNQFTRMETSLSKLNSTQTSLSNYFS